MKVKIMMGLGLYLVEHIVVEMINNIIKKYESLFNSHE